jgi:hypothetical protein
VFFNRKGLELISGLLTLNRVAHDL